MVIPKEVYQEMVKQYDQLLIILDKNRHLYNELVKIELEEKGSYLYNVHMDEYGTGNPATQIDKIDPTDGI